MSSRNLQGLGPSLSQRSYSTLSQDEEPVDAPIDQVSGSSPENSEKEEVRLSRKDLNNIAQPPITRSASEGIKARNTPKNLRFQLISPSASNASTSSYDFAHQPVVIKPLAGSNAQDFSKPQKKASVIATVNGSETSGSSTDYNRAFSTVGHPTPVDFNSDGNSSTTSGTTSASTFNTASSESKIPITLATPKKLIKLPITLDRPDDTVLLPREGRTHCNAIIGAERPRENDHDYFQFNFPPSKRACGVIIPFFNEEENELRRTLESLETQSKYIWRDKGLAIHVVLIMDGWSKAAESMQDYIKFLFPPANPKLPWWSTLEDKTQNDVIESLFVQRIIPCGKKRARRCVTLGEVSVDPSNKDRKIYITLIVKRDNRRKHNSHEWFFGRAGFAEFYKHEFLFATDCGTGFEEDCLYALLSYMERNPTTSVVTGRQRVMSRAQQGSKESLISLDTLYRMAQCYDYESSFACFMGAFALFGFLPVVPGPCGLYRANDILGQARDWYFDVVNTEPDETGLVLGNLRIAEDRVLSYAAVLKTAEARRMALIPEATFYFEAECNLEKFLLQRRRWTNGTVAGYIYMCVQNPGILFRAKMNPIRKFCVFCLLLCQLLVYLVVAVSPAIFLNSLKSTLGAVFPIDGGYPQLYPQIAWYLVVALYVYMVITHSKVKYRAWMFYILLVISAFTIVGAFYTFGSFIAANGVQVQTDDWQWLAIMVVLAVTVLPIVIAFLHSPKSFALMIISIVPYYLFLPMLVGWFSAYAFARTWDLTWGNRPANSEHSTQSATRKANIEAALRAKAMTLCIFVVLANLIFILLVEQFQGLSFLILILLCFNFSFAVGQMFFSCIYFLLYYDPRRVIQTAWYIISYPFKKKRRHEVDPDENDEYMSSAQFPATGKSGSRVGSRSVSRAASMRNDLRQGSQYNLRPSFSKQDLRPASNRNLSIHEVNPEIEDTSDDESDADSMMDPTVETPETVMADRSPSSINIGGPIKRTSSIANAV